MARSEKCETPPSSSPRSSDGSSIETRDEVSAIQSHDDPETWNSWYTSQPQIWSGLANHTLIEEVGSLQPGTALEVGCGEGADAIWLAHNGWTVTAIDVSSVALQRARAEATRLKLEVTWKQLSLGAANIAPGSFDLVTAHYPTLARTPGHDEEYALIRAVAPGGHLLVVHHRGVDLDRAKEHGIDPSSYLQPRDVLQLLGEDWHVRYDDLRHRPHLETGAGAHHHVDIVLHAQRLRT